MPEPFAQLVQGILQIRIPSILLLWCGKQVHLPGQRGETVAAKVQGAQSYAALPGALQQPVGGIHEFEVKGLGNGKGVCFLLADAVDIAYLETQTGAAPAQIAQAQTAVFGESSQSGAHCCIVIVGLRKHGLLDDGG